MMRLKFALIIAACVGTVAATSCTKNDSESTSETQSYADSQSAGATIPRLQDTLDAHKAQSAENAPPDVVQTIADGIQEIAESQVMETALTAGDTAPDFALPDAVGDTVQLSTLLADGPVILTWYRGGW